VASIPQVFRTESPSPKPTPELPSPRNDEPFQRFYTTFETLISKISAPLAFAGLPLIPSSDSEPPIKPSPPQPKPPVPPSSDPSTAEIDYNKFFSRAALRALREEHGPKGGGGGFGTAAESFYVVPTTGGTISYADILARAQQEANLSKHHTASPSNPEDLRDDDEFVDARETPQPASPILTRTGARHHQNPPPGTKTMEELVLENSALRALADQFSKRLAEFEMGAQTSSLALHTSIRAMARSQSEGAAGMAGAGDERAKRLGEERVMRLEEEAGGLRKEAERLGRENEKLRGVVGRYRERWEKLKEGARGRREGGAGGRGEEG